VPTYVQPETAGFEHITLGSVRPGCTGGFLTRKEIEE
jgi:hypothetical protein